LGKNFPRDYVNQQKADGNAVGFFIIQRVNNSSMQLIENLVPKISPWINPRGILRKL